MEKNSDHSNNWVPPFWYWLLIPVAVVLFQIVVGMQGSSLLAYSDFKRLLHAGKINELTIAEDTIAGTLKAEGLEAILPRHEVAKLKCTPERGCPFTTNLVLDPTLTNDVEASEVRFVGATLR